MNSHAPRRFCRLIAAFLVPWYTAACYHWQAASLAPAQAVETGHKTLRVTLANGQRHALYRASIVGDSLRGLEYRGAMDDYRPTAVALSDIKRLDVRQIDGAATAAAVVGGVLVVGTIAAIIAVANSDFMGGGDSWSGGGGGSGDIYYGCPLAYSHDGSDWRLDSGTFAGAIAQSVARTDVDVLEYARAEHDILRLRLTDELNETDHTDAIRVMAVDHAPGVTIAPDADGKLYALGSLTLPTAARDFRGRDALARVLDRDGWSWESVPTGRDSANAADIRDGLELAFPRPHGASHARLVLDGRNSQWASILLAQFVGWHGNQTKAWYDSLNAEPARARGLAALESHVGGLTVSVWAGKQWRAAGYIQVAGPEVAKQQVAALDLSGVAGDAVRVRLEGTPSFWLIDRLALDFSPPQPFRAHEALLERAVDDRGHDVAAELTAIDGRYYTAERGDGAELSFRASPLAAGMARTWVVQSTGWYQPHSDETAAAQTALLDRLARDPTAALRIAVAQAGTIVGASAARRP